MNKIVNIKTIMTITFIIMLIVMSTISLADEEYSVGMTLTSSSKLNEGETVIVNVNLTNIVAGDGINAITAKLNYDKNVFEQLSTTNFKSANNWMSTFSENTNKMVIFKTNKVTQGETVLSIELKVKSSINVDSTTITLQDITVSGGILGNGGTGDICVKNTSVTIIKPQESKTTENKNQGTKQQTNTTNTNNNKTNTTNTSTNIENSNEKYSALISLTSDSKLKESGTVLINIDLTSINAGSGINALTAKLNYDTNIFEQVKTSNFKTVNNWTATFSTSTNKLVLITTKKVAQPETMITVMLKVKSGVTVNSAIITLQDITVSGGKVSNGGTGDIAVGNATLTINREMMGMVITKNRENTIEQQLKLMSKISKKGVTINRPEKIEMETEIDCSDSIIADTISYVQSVKKGDMNKENESQEVETQEYIIMASTGATFLGLSVYGLRKKFIKI